MTASTTPQIGDQVIDPTARQMAIVTDVHGGNYVLRADKLGEWIAENPRLLTVLVRREDRLNGAMPPAGD